MWVELRAYIYTAYNFLCKSICIAVFAAAVLFYFTFVSNL